MADTGKGKGAPAGPAAGGASAATDKLGEAEVLHLVLDYLATKGFTEAEETLRQSVSAAGGSPKKGNSNQHSGELDDVHVDTRILETCRTVELLRPCLLHGRGSPRPPR